MTSLEGITREITEMVRSNALELGFVRGISTAAILARQLGHIDLANRLGELSFKSELAHLEHDERMERAAA